MHFCTIITSFAFSNATVRCIAYIYRQWILLVLLEVCVKVHYISSEIDWEYGVLREGICSVRSCADGYSPPWSTQSRCRNCSGTGTQPIDLNWLRVYDICISSRLVKILWSWYDIVTHYHTHMYLRTCFWISLHIFVIGLSCYRRSS